MTTALAEKVLAEGPCPCGGKYMVLKIKGQPIPQKMHSKPGCKEFSSMPSMAYLAWVKAAASDVGGNVEKPDIQPSRKERRRRAADERRKKRHAVN